MLEDLRVGEVMGRRFWCNLPVTWRSFENDEEVAIRVCGGR